MFQGLRIMGCCMHNLWRTLRLTGAKENLPPLLRANRATDPPTYSSLQFQTKLGVAPVHTFLQISHCGGPRMQLKQGCQRKRPRITSTSARLQTHNCARMASPWPTTGGKGLRCTGSKPCAGLRCSGVLAVIPGFGSIKTVKCSSWSEIFSLIPFPDHLPELIRSALFASVRQPVAERNQGIA